MKYLLIHRLDEALIDPAEEDVSADELELDQEIGVWDAEMEQRGVMLSGGRLRPAREARSVRVRGGQALVTDGPFAETKEQVAGFHILECDSMAEAIQVAARHPTARIGTFELRALGSVPG
jgi:hypothetical protein